jgi:hypothetical protein
MALGGNSAIEGVASLINHLDGLLQLQRKRAPNCKPSGTALSAAFAAYELQQRQRMRELMGLSNMVAKMHTYATPLYRFLADWVLPLQDDRRFAARIGAYVASAPRIDFLPLRNFTKGRIPWKKGEDEGEEVPEE